MTYRKKPVEVQAMQWDGTVEGMRILRAFCPDMDDKIYAYTSINQDGKAQFDALNGDPMLRIKTLEGEHWARVNDWIIKGVKGEFYPCKPDIFAATYDPVPELDHEAYGVTF